MKFDVYSMLRVTRWGKGTIEDFPISLIDTRVGTLCPEVFHAHEFIEMVVVYNGEGNHVVNGLIAPIREGDVLLLYPHDIHGFTECRTLGLLNVMYVPAKLPIPILDGERIPLFRRFFPVDLNYHEFRSTAAPVLHLNSREDLDRVTADARMLQQELVNRQPGNIMCSVIRLLSLLTMTLRIGQPLVNNTLERRHFTMGKILDFLNKNFTRKISQDELCRMAFCSPRSFQRKFKNHTGYTPNEYIARKRIAAAQELLLKKPELAIGEVGFACGYIDSVYFSRKFRQIVQMTPKEWRLAKGLASRL